MTKIRVAAALYAFAALTFLFNPGAAGAAPYADIVMEMRSGKILHGTQPDRRLHPASLTKMMTLYLTFEAVTSGRVKLDQRVKISRRAASRPPSRIGLRTGQRVTIRDLIRAAAVKSANDAAVALAEAVGGSEPAFARMMTAKARKLGMKNTTFKNASGLTQSGHLSSARDMALLARALFMDFPQYYNIFGRKKTRAMGRTVHSTNRRMLNGYAGADGVKTGYTSAAGYNLASSAHRNGVRVLAVIFGEKSVPARTRHMMKLLDLGFRKAPRGAPRVSTQTMASRYGAKPKASYKRVAKAPAPRLRPGAKQTDVVSALIASAADTIAPPAHAAVNADISRDAMHMRSPAPRPRPGSKTAATAAQPAREAKIAAAPRTAPAPQSAAALRESLDLASVDWAVQLGVFSERESAVAQLASVAMGGVNGLSGAKQEVDMFNLSGRTAYRARLIGMDRTSALAACAAIRGKGGECVPVAEAAN